MDDFIFGIRSVMEAVSAGKEIEKVLLQQKFESELHQDLFRQLREKQIPWQFVPVEKLNRITRKNHQGVIAYISHVSYTALDEIVARSYESGRDPFILILDHISDVRNFGAIARTAECAGMNGIVIPDKGSVRVTADAVKTSAGALMTLPVSRVGSLKEAVIYLKDAGLTVVGASEKTEDTIYNLDLSGPLAVILGSEDSGISGVLLDLCDHTARIPLFGQISSLNVSVAASVIIYEVIRQRIQAGLLK